MNGIQTRAAHDTAANRLTALTRQLDLVQTQIATGKRVTKPGDDAVAFSRAAVLHRAQAAAEATQRGIDAGQRRLSATDNALSGISTLVQRVRELALQANNATVSADDRQTIAVELGEISSQVISLADSRGSDGERLFGGAAATGPAYGTAVDGSGVWAGAGAAPQVAIAGDPVGSSVTGPQAFGASDAVTGSRDLFGTLADLKAALAEPDGDKRTAALGLVIGQLDGHVSRLADARGMVGARGARLDGERERLAQASVANEADLSTLESTDATAAIARLQRLMTVLQAAQASFAKVSSQSLWDAIR